MKRVNVVFVSGAILELPDVYNILYDSQMRFVRFLRAGGVVVRVNYDQISWLEEVDID